MLSTHRGALDTTLQRDLAVLSSLAHLNWLTTGQFHVLRFAGCMLSAVRTTLQTRSHLHPVRLHTWQRLEAGISEKTWWDEQGQACSLQSGAAVPG